MLIDPRKENSFKSWWDSLKWHTPTWCHLRVQAVMENNGDTCCELHQQLHEYSRDFSLLIHRVHFVVVVLQWICGAKAFSDNPRKISCVTDIFSNMESTNGEVRTNVWAVVFLCVSPCRLCRGLRVSQCDVHFHWAVQGPPRSLRLCLSRSPRCWTPPWPNGTPNVLAWLRPRPNLTNKMFGWAQSTCDPQVRSVKTED